MQFVAQRGEHRTGPSVFVGELLEPVGAVEKQPAHVARTDEVEERSLNTRPPPCFAALTRGRSSGRESPIQRFEFMSDAEHQIQQRRGDNEF